VIFPFLRGFVKFETAPLTWMLVYLNFVLFAFTSDVTPWKEIEAFQTADNMVLTGQLFYQFQNPKEETLPERSPEDWMVAGGQALRDRVFVFSSMDRSYRGDQIAIEEWKKNLSAMAESLETRSMHVFGLNGFADEPIAWLTYQFTHGGWAHLITNCLVLLIFGAALEALVRPAEYLILYLGFGFISALGFLAVSTSGLIPLVGASGCISGIMTCYLTMERKKNVAYAYFLAPAQGYMGLIYLPVFLMWPLSVLPDLVGYLTAVDELGVGVAYAAHLGGAVAGAFYGFTRRRMQDRTRKYATNLY
jgi:membrane associated rhomboid family serine protease